MIIFAAATDGLKSSGPIHGDRRIAVADFEMDSAGTGISRVIDKALQQPTSYTAAARLRINGQQQ